MVSEAEDTPDEQFEQAAVKLDQGLKSCRTVVANYRSMLADAQDEPGEPAGLDSAPAAP